MKTNLKQGKVIKLGLSIRLNPFKWHYLQYNQSGYNNSYFGILLIGGLMIYDRALFKNILLFTWN